MLTYVHSGNGGQLESMANHPSRQFQHYPISVPVTIPVDLLDRVELVLVAPQCRVRILSLSFVLSCCYSGAKPGSGLTMCRDPDKDIPAQI